MRGEETGEPNTKGREGGVNLSLRLASHFHLAVQSSRFLLDLTVALT